MLPKGAPSACATSARACCPRCNSRQKFCPVQAGDLYPQTMPKILYRAPQCAPRAGRRAQTSATVLCCQDCNPDHGLSKRVRRAAKANRTLAELCCLAAAHAAAKHTCACRAAPVGCKAEKIELGRRQGLSKLGAADAARGPQSLNPCTTRQLVSSLCMQQRGLAPADTATDARHAGKASNQHTW